MEYPFGFEYLTLTPSSKTISISERVDLHVDISGTSLVLVILNAFEVIVKLPTEKL